MRHSEHTKREHQGTEHVQAEEGKQKKALTHDEELFSALVYGRSSLSNALLTAQEPPSSPAPVAKAENARAVVREWAERLWASQSGSLLHVVTRAGEVPITISSNLVNGALNISVVCSDPAFLERMKQNWADLERKASLSKVKIVLFVDTPSDTYSEQYQTQNADVRKENTDET